MTFIELELLIIILGMVLVILYVDRKERRAQSLRKDWPKAASRITDQSSDKK